MADVKISQLSAATSFVEASEFPVNELGTTKKLTGTLLKAGIGNTLRNQSTVNQNIAAGVTAYLTNSGIAVPVGKLRVGTVFKWRLSVSKTAAGTTANTFTVRVGTAGTTADAAILAFTTGTATAVVDQGIVQIDVVCRGPLSASGVFQGAMELSHELASTGLHNKATQVHLLTSAPFDVTVANLVVGLSCTTAASTVLDFAMLTAQATNL